MPKFSIVITATRPHLVGYALRSAMDQDIDDFEVIVSDNSEQGCHEIVAAFADPRIRYIRPKTYMTTVPHWNFAFSHAHGEWQLLLCDDDAMAPNLLATIDGRLQIHDDVDTISWQYANYTYDGTVEALSGDRLGVPAFSGADEVIESRVLVEEMFHSGTGLFRATKRKVPFVPRSVYSRRLIERIRKHLGGQLFLPPCPMTSGAIAALGVSNKSLRLDLPLYVIGVTPDSAAAYTSDRTTYDRMHRGVGIELAPVKSMTLFPSANADALLRAQAAMPEQLGGYELNLENYFFACHLAIRELEEADVDVEIEKDLLASVLESQPAELVRQVEARIRTEESAVAKKNGTRVRRCLARVSNALQRLRAALGYKRFSMGQVLDIRKAGLRDIVDCAGYLARLTRHVA